MEDFKKKFHIAVVGSQLEEQSPYPTFKEAIEVRKIQLKLLV